MPQTKLRPSYGSLQMAYIETCNVLHGFTHDGELPSPIRVPFSKDPEVRMAAARLIMRIAWYCGIFTEGQREDRTALFAKLLAHLNKTGRQSVESIQNFKDRDDIAEAIAVDRALLRQPIGIAGILRLHKQRTHIKAVPFTLTLPSEIPPRTLLWKDPTGTHRLEEATDPRHPQQDSAALRHCVGKVYSTYDLRRYRLTADQPEAIHCLTYWLSIRHGKSRIFTLMVDGLPAVTLEYSIKRQALEQLRGIDRIRRDNPLYDVLDEALRATGLAAGLRHLVPPTPPQEPRAPKSDTSWEDAWFEDV